MLRLSPLVLLFFLLFGWSTSLSLAGDLIAYDSAEFDATTAVGSVDSDVQLRRAFHAGWWGLWYGTADVAVGGLTYTNLQVSGNRFVTDGYNSASWLAPYPADHPTLVTNGYFGRDGTTLWLSFLYRAETSLGSDIYQGLSLFDEGTEELFIGATIGSTMVGFHAWDFGQAPNGVTASRKSALGGTHLIVVRLTFGVSGTSDRVELFVDPSPGVVPRVADGSRTGANIRFNWIRLQSGYGFTRASIDEIRLGTTYEAVTPVKAGTPELKIDELQFGPYGVVPIFRSASTLPFVLESSSNFEVWTPFFTNTLSSQFSSWLDASTPAKVSRFYRLRRQ